MATLDYKTNLKLQLESDSLAEVKTTGVTWIDSSGNSNDHSGTASIATNVTPTGRAALSLNGSQVLTGPIQSSYLSSSNWTILAVFKATNVTANNATIPLNDCIIGGSVQAGPGMFVRNNGPTFYAYNNDGTQDSVATTIATNTWYIGIARLRAGGVVLESNVDDIYNLTSTASGNSANLTSVSKIGENYSAAAWFTGYIAAILAYNANVTNNNMASVINYLASKYLYRGDPTEQTRDILSRRLFSFSQPRLKTQITVPPQYADVELLTDVAISHPFGPNASTSGWKNDVWSRQPMRVTEWSFDPESMTVGLELSDLKNRSVTYRDTLRATKTVSNKREGMAAISGLTARQFARDSDAYVVTPADSFTVAKVTKNQEKLSNEGFIAEDPVDNFITKSSFIAGTSSLTLSGSGISGSTISASSSDPLLFDTNITSFSLKYTAGNPHSTRLMAQFPDTTGTDGRVRILNIDHRDNNLTALVYILQRLADNRYWTSSSSWASTAEVMNPITITATSSSIERYSEVIMTNFTSTAGLRLSVGLASSGTNSRVNHVYHVELVRTIAGASSTGACVGTRVVTDGTKLTRAQDRLAVVSNSTQATIQDQGTILLKLKPEWSGTDYSTTAQNFPLLQVGDTSGGYWQIGWSASNRRWDFKVVNSTGTSATAYSSHEPVRGTEYAMAFRWTSTEGEFGLSSRTMQSFVNGVGGVTANATGYPTISSNIYLYDERGTFGVNNATVNGTISEFEIRPYCMSDEEIVAWSS